MNYEDAIYANVTRAEAIAEIKEHGVSVLEFFNEVGDRAEYLGSDVLDWLGY